MREKKGVAWLLIFAMVIGVVSPVGPIRKVEAEGAAEFGFVLGSGDSYHYYVSADAVVSGNSYKTLADAFDNINNDNSVDEDDNVIIHVSGTISATREAKLIRKCHVIVRPDSGKATIKRTKYFDGSIINIAPNETFDDIFNYPNNFQMKDVILDGGIIWEDSPIADPLGRSNKCSGNGFSPKPIGAAPGDDGYMGAAFKLTTGDIRLTDCIIENNYNDHPSYGQVKNPDYPSKSNNEYIEPYDSGGGIHIGGSGIFNLDGCIIRNNFSRHQGGGIWKSGCVKMKENCEIYGNRAEEWGGGIYQYDGLCEIIGSTIRNNSAKGSGGGINIHSGMFTIENTTVCGNYMDGEAGAVGSSMGGAGIRIENNNNASGDAANGTFIKLKGGVTVSGNASNALKDGTGKYEDSAPASGVMIDIPRNDFMMDPGFEAGISSNYVCGSGVCYDSSTGTYKASGDATPEYNIGYVGMPANAEPTVTVSGNAGEYTSGNAEVKLYHRGATETLTVDVKNPSSVSADATPSITYQWYQVDETGKKISKLAGQTSNEYTLSSDDRVEKYYSCEVSYQVDTTKLPARVMTIPVRATVYSLKAKDFIIKKADLENSSIWTNLDVARGSDYADLKWEDGTAVSGDADVKCSVPVDIDEPEDIVNNGCGRYELKYTHKHTNGKATSTTSNMYVVDLAEDIIDENNNVIGKVGANNIVISAERAKQLMKDQAALKSELGVYVIKDGVIDNTELNNITAVVPEQFDMPGVHTVGLKYKTKVLTSLSVRVVKVGAGDFSITVSKLNALKNFDQTMAEGYAHVRLLGVDYDDTDFDNTVSVYKVVNPLTQKDITLGEMQQIGVGTDNYKEYKITYWNEKTKASCEVDMVIIPDIFDEDSKDGLDRIKLHSSMIDLEWSEVIGKDNDDEELKELLMARGEPIAVKNNKIVKDAPITIKEVNIFDENHELKMGHGLYGPRVTFECGEAISVSQINIVPADDESLYNVIMAEDFIVSLDAVKQIKPADVIAKSKARYFTGLTDIGKASGVSVDADSLAQLKSIKKAGDVSITLIAPDCEAKIVTAHVVDMMVGDDSDNPVMTIGASKIAIEKSDIPKNSDALKATLKDLGKPVATDRGKTIETTDSRISVGKVSIYEDDNTTLKAAPTVTFEYRRGSVNENSRAAQSNSVEITVPVRVLYRNLTAKDNFSVDVADGTLTAEAFIQKAQVSAKDQDGKDVAVVVDPVSLKRLNDAIAVPETAPGKYQVKVMTASGKDVKQVTVIVNGSGGLAAGDFIITKAQLNAMKDLKETMGEGFAFVGKDDNPVTSGDGISVASVMDTKTNEAYDLAGLQARESGHSYKITYKDDVTEASITVIMMVVDGASGSGAASGEADVIVIGAEHIVAQEKDILGKDEEELKALFMELGNPQATLNGLEVPQEWIDVSSIDIFDTETNNRKDSPTVTFEYDGATYMTPVSIVGEPLKYPVLFANDFVISLKDAGKAADKEIREKSNARYYKRFTDKSETANMLVDAAGKNALNNAQASDEVMITFTVNGTSPKSKTVKAYVRDKTESGKDSDNHDVVIGANNITIDKLELPASEAALKTKLKNLGKPVATDKGVLIPTTNAKLNVSDLGIYESNTNTISKKPTVTFEYDGVEVRVDITVTGIEEAVSGDASGDGTSNGDAGGNSSGDNKTSGDASGSEKDKDDLTFDISNPQDIPIAIEPGKVVDKVTVDGNVLPDSDYKTDGDKLVISNSVFAGKGEGNHTIEVSFKDGTKKTLNIKVVAFDEKTVVPLNKVPIFNVSKTIGVGKKYKLNLVGLGSNAYIDPNNTKSSNKKVATIDPKTMVIKGKKKGKCNIQVAVVQNGSYYSVKLKLTVKKNKATYNIKKKALSKKKGILPEFNDYMSVKKGKKTKLKFSQVEKSAKVKYTTGNKKIATVSKKGVIKGKKKGFVWITAQIEQNGHTYYTRILVQVDDKTKNKKFNKYLTKKLK